MFYTTACTIFAGHLPSPENFHVKRLFNSLTVIEWNPPYSALNNESDVVHVDPYVTQYTVHVIDNYTGNSIHEVNVTETHYTIRSNASDDSSCPMYRITAWNSGGEGGMSGPVYPPQGKPTFFHNHG